ncbi:MAG: hypothetical protein G01um101456_315 [Parcubacteria group bacterium Gr01-1014_56]|nr:MAG: hypothetical protein G01um101456_315 [Parcubacteria group bacterium Gr01-1014_56]
MNKKIFFTKRGFTAFFAVLISSLALAVGLSIYDLLVRGLLLSQTASQSQYAIFAADAGVECALYWDAKAPILNGSPSVFGTSSGSTWGASPIACNTQNITVQGPPLADLVQYPGCSSSAWCITSNSNAATTTFTIFFTPQTYCATVVVAKSGNPSQTSVVSHGFNDCTTTGPVRLERALQVRY